MCESIKPNIETSVGLKNIKTAVSECGLSPMRYRSTRACRGRRLNKSHFGFVFLNPGICIMYKNLHIYQQILSADVYLLQSFLVNKELYPHQSALQTFAFSLVVCLWFMLFLIYRY